MNSLLSHRHRLLLFVLPALLASASCDDVSTTEGRYAAYLDDFADAHCEGLYECGQTTASWGTVFQPAAGLVIQEPNLYASRSDCVRTVRSAVRATLTPTLRDALASGTTRFDAEAARSCLEALRGLGPGRCEDSQGTGAVCRRVLVGQQPDGAACRTSEECSSLSSCDTTATGCRACARHFPDPAGLGEPCDWGGRRCAEGLACTPTGPGPFDSTCVAVTPPVSTVVAEGEPCGRVQDGSVSVCDRGLFCRYEPNASTGVCSAPIAVGQPCLRDTGDVCALGSDCIPPAVSEPGVCTPVTVATREGASCDPSAWSVSTCSLAANLGCDAVTKRCVSPAPGNENAGCEGDWDCTPPYHCEAARCLPPRPEGWRCRSDVTCASAVCEIAPTEIEGLCGASRAVPLCE
ncbi:MAG: hypothetical protein U0230_21985 [Polyangiales bacterium]